MRNYEIVIIIQLIFNKKEKSKAISVEDQRVPGS